MAEPSKSEAKQQPQPQFPTSDIAIINLVHPAGFDSEAQTVIIGRNADAALETAHGILVQRRVGLQSRAVVDPAATVERYLLPWANIRSVKYAQPAATKA